ncbi:MAG: hypothetical protein FP814_00415 [Desulfobacterium sp.]|nr:hypothetical protein [Desulfobacterium sp.]MBU3949696.1 hypothetical protein [Pseudomonadota bacterium]MBU4010822.1 hypothetical protein [Pseudomonadota bacterium]MBU4036792.1 hypothetical protein [Pseudomonadota bacterium]
MEQTNLYSDAHLVVAAIRILERRNPVPPSIENICNFLSFSPELGNYLCRKLDETGVIEIVEGPFGTRLFLKNHLALEEIPKNSKTSSMDEELEKFKNSRKGLDQRVASIQAEQAEKKKTLFAKLEDQLKKHLENR